MATFRKKQAGDAFLKAYQESEDSFKAGWNAALAYALQAYEDHQRDKRLQATAVHPIEKIKLAKQS